MESSYISRTSGIGMKDKVGYALGDFASVLVFGLVQSVLQKYYTDVLGIGVVSIMVMFIVARIWDAINDPLWGRIIDSAPVWPDGRYRHWLKVFCVPVAIAAILMFVKIPGLSEKGYLVYAYVTYILFGMLYTCINIPYGSMAQVITSDEKERSSLSVFRSIGSTFGAIPAMLLISLCYVKLADGRSVMSYQKIITGVAVIAVLSIVGFLLSYAWTRERVHTKPALKTEGQTMKVLKILLHSRPFMAVCVASMLFLAAQMFGQSYYTYLFNYYFNAPGLSMLPTACQYLPVVVIMFFAGKLGNRYGRREVCAYGMLLAGAFSLVLYLMGTKNVWLADVPAAEAVAHPGSEEHDDRYRQILADGGRGACEHGAAAHRLYRQCAQCLQHHGGHAQADVRRLRADPGGAVPAGVRAAALCLPPRQKADRSPADPEGGEPAQTPRGTGLIHEFCASCILHFPDFCV